MTVDAARIVLEAGDAALLAQVLAGRVALTAAADTARRRVRLAESFKAASAEDRAEFVRIVGPDVLFNVLTAA